MSHLAGTTGASHPGASGAALGCCAAAALTLTLATPAMAQNQRSLDFDTGSRIGVPARARIPESSKLSPADQGRIAMAEYARCVVARYPAKVEAALKTPFGKAYTKAVGKIATSECLDSGMMKFPSIVLRGALFTELWRIRVAAEAKGATWGPKLPPVDAAHVEKDAASKQNAGLVYFADCVAKLDPAAASDVVTRRIASAEQAEAYMRLTPNLGPCFPEGGSIKLSKPVLEGALAEAMYRGTVTPQNGSKVQ